MDGINNQEQYEFRVEQARKQICNNMFSVVKSVKEAARKERKSETDAAIDFLCSMLAEVQFQIFEQTLTIEMLEDDIDDLYECDPDDCLTCDERETCTDKPEPEIL